MLREWRVLEIEEPVSSTQIREEADVQHIDKKIEKSVKEILKGQNT
jgi:hypothetical protein